MDIAQGQGYPLEIIIITDDSSPMPTDDDIPAWVHWPEFYPRRASSEAPRSSKRARVAATEDAILGLQEVTGRSGDECAVCLQDFRAEETLRAMPCSHAFHQHCISQWLRRNARGVGGDRARAAAGAGRPATALARSLGGIAGACAASRKRSPPRSCKPASSPSVVGDAGAGDAGADEDAGAVEDEGVDAGCRSGAPRPPLHGHDGAAVASRRSSASISGKPARRRETEGVPHEEAG
nr:E3 ubiquitin-protein ligase Os03g0188200-like [Setaria viridis]